MRRSTTARVLSDVLEREMFRALRQETGLSYTAQTGYEVHGDGTATIVAVAEALPEKADAVLGGFVDVLAKLRVGRIDPADVQSVVGKAVDGFGNAEADAQRLPGYAFTMLVGQPNLTDAGDDFAALMAAADADMYRMKERTRRAQPVIAPR